MPKTKFPYGVSSYNVPVVPWVWNKPLGFNGPGSTSQPGSNVFFVNSATKLAADAAGSNGLTPQVPFKTLNYALTQTVNNNGDVIYCGPQHVETVIAGGGLTFPSATAAGVTVVMQGNYTDRATVNFTTSTTARVTIVASNVTWINPMFTCGIDALADAVSVNGPNCTLVGVDFVNTLAACAAIQILTIGAAVNLRIYGYNYNLQGTITGTEPTEAIRIVGGSGHVLENVNIQGAFSTGCLNNITTAFHNLALINSYLCNLDTGPIPAWALLTTSTGIGAGVILSVASGSTWITASNKIAFDLASSGVIPGGTPASPI